MKYEINLGKNVLEDLFKDEKGRKAQEIVPMDIKELKPYAEQPFKVLLDNNMDELCASIEQYGVLSPIIVRPHSEGVYEVLSGHRRMKACELLGIEEVPVVIKDLDDDTAAILLVDSNLQRENILPSEKTYDENGKPNAMNAAWGGISEETQISICVDDGHRTAKNVVKTGAFTVSIADVENVVACDYVGIVSGNKESDKIEKAGWHVTKSEFVNAPLFDELPMALECKLISYDKETCRLVGEIVNVCADERILDDNGKIDLNKFSPITYDPVYHTYRKIGDVVGKAFSDGNKLK